MFSSRLLMLLCAELGGSQKSLGADGGEATEQTSERDREREQSGAEGSWSPASLPVKLRRPTADVCRQKRSRLQQLVGDQIRVSAPATSCAASTCSQPDVPRTKHARRNFSNYCYTETIRWRTLKQHKPISEEWLYLVKEKYFLYCICNFICNFKTLFNSLLSGWSRPIQDPFKCQPSLV